MSECDGCDMECKDHGTMGLLVEQHDSRITDMEQVSADISNDVAKIEGRINTFIWAVGLGLFVLVSVASYGAVQLNEFKDVYLKDSIILNKTLSEIQSDMKHMKSDMTRMERRHDRLEGGQ